MITISQQQTFQRWDTLPEEIREALASEDGANFLWRICEAEHLPKEKIRGVSRAAGYVLMGFMHPGDLAHEMQEENIVPNKPVAESIAKAINDRIFEPLREEIDRIYEPPSRIKPPIEFPKIIEEIKPPAPIPAAPPIQKTPGPIDISKIFSAKPPEKKEGPAPSSPTPTVPKPFDFASLDTARDGQGRTKMSQPPAPTIPPRMPQPTIAPPAATGKPMSEFERLKLQKEGASAAPQPTKPEGPSILYKEPEARPGEKAAGFKLEIPVPKFGEKKPFDVASLDTARDKRGKAVFEFGLDGKLEPPKPAAPPAPRVVNYSDLRTPLPPLPKKEEGGAASAKSYGPLRHSFGEASEPREIKEFTASAPSAPPSKLPLLGDEKMMHPSFAKATEGKPPAQPLSAEVLTKAEPPPPPPPPAPPRLRIEPPPVPPRPLR